MLLNQIGTSHNGMPILSFVANGSRTVSQLDIWLAALRDDRVWAVIAAGRSCYFESNA